MKKKYTFIAYVEVEIDTENSLYEEYENDREIIHDAVSYRFSPVCPAVDENLIVIKNIEAEEIEEKVKPITQSK